MISIDGIFGLALVPLFSVLVITFVAVLFFKAFNLASAKAKAKAKASQRAMHIAELNATYESNQRKLVDRRRFSDRRAGQEDRRNPIAA